MCVRTGRSGQSQIIRLETDMVMEPDLAAVREIVNRALSEGIGEFVLSVSIGSLTNRRLVSGLIEWCHGAVRQAGGRLLFVEKNDGGAPVFGALCESLHIPLCLNVDTAVVETAAPTGA